MSLLRKLFTPSPKKSLEEQIFEDEQRLDIPHHLRQYNTNKDKLALENEELKSEVRRLERIHNQNGKVRLIAGQEIDTPEGRGVVLRTELDWCNMYYDKNKMNVLVWVHSKSVGNQIIDFEVRELLKWNNYWR